ncbi:MAG: hypothetical protein OXG83_17435 [Acidobacteria bacterium]|nr:hypothetical protein [Acidobacteriota bacterium]
MTKPKKKPPTSPTSAAVRAGRILTGLDEDPRPKRRRVVIDPRDGTVKPLRSEQGR